MAWKNKNELYVENTILKREVELLREQLKERKEELVEVKQQLRFTQEALVAKESPEAYRDQKQIEELAKQAPESREKREEREQQNKIMSEYLNHLEDPLFRDADEMIQLFTNSSISKIGSKSLHGNSES